jgi:hypothetical protein
VGASVSSAVDDGLSLNTDPDGLSGSGVHAEPEPSAEAAASLATSMLAWSVLGEGASADGDSSRDASGAGGAGAVGSDAAGSVAGGFDAFVFGLNQDPDGLSESGRRGDSGLSSDAFWASGVDSDHDGLGGLVGSLLAASGRYAPDGLSGTRGSAA